MVKDLSDRIAIVKLHKTGKSSNISSFFSKEEWSLSLLILNPLDQGFSNCRLQPQMGLCKKILGLQNQIGFLCF